MRTVRVEVRIIIEYILIRDDAALLKTVKIQFNTFHYMRDMIVEYITELNHVHSLSADGLFHIYGLQLIHVNGRKENIVAHEFHITVN